MNGRIKLLAEREADRRKHIVDLTDTPIKDLAVSSGYMIASPTLMISWGMVIGTVQ